MRVIHIDTGRDWRGGQSQVLMLARGMMVQGWDVRIAARRGSLLKERAAEHGIPFEEFAFRFEADPAAAFALSRMQASAGTTTLYHAHTPHALGLAVMARVIGTTSPIVFTRRVAFPIRKFFVNRWKLNQADRLIAVSEAVAGQLRNAAIPKEKIRVIHSSVDIDAFPFHGSNTVEPLNVVLLGAVEQAKGLNAAMQFVESAERVPVIFHFIGGGSDLARLQNWAAGRKSVRVHGFLSNVQDFLPNMFAAMSFSPSEGFPNLVLQCMSLGLPVLAFSNDAVKEIIVNDDLGFLFHTADEAMAKLIEWMSHKEVCEKIGRQASEWVRSRYSVDRMVDRTLSLYKEILA